MQPLLMPGMKVEGADGQALRAMMEIQSQWQMARPEQVRYLQWKEKLHQNLLQAQKEAYSTIETLLEGDVPPSEARQEGMAYVAMPTLEDSPRLPSRLSPFGQPNLSKSLRSGTPNAT